MFYSANELLRIINQRTFVVYTYSFSEPLSSFSFFLWRVIAPEQLSCSLVTSSSFCLYRRCVSWRGKQEQRLESCVVHYHRSFDFDLLRSLSGMNISKSFPIKFNRCRADLSLQAGYLLLCTDLITSLYNSWVYIYEMWRLWFPQTQMSSHLSSEHVTYI